MASFGNWSAACSLAVQVPLQQQNEKLYALSGITIFAFGVSAAASCVVFRLWLRLDHEAKASIWLLYVPHLPSSDYHVLGNSLQLWLVPWSHAYRQLRGFVVLGLQRAFPRLLFRIFQPSNLRRSLLSQSLSHRRAAETNHIWALARLFSRLVRLRPQRFSTIHNIHLPHALSRYAVEFLCLSSSKLLIIDRLIDFSVCCCCCCC